MISTVTPPRRIHALRKEVRLAAEHRSGLLAHVGENPTTMQLALVTQLEQIFLQLRLMDTDFRRTGTRTVPEQKTYNTLIGQQSRLFRQLGLKAAAEHTPDLAELLTRSAARRASAARNGSAHAGDQPSPHAANAALVPGTRAVAA